jgi:hypothetical protein
MERISAMKRFVVIMWDLNAFTGIDLNKDLDGIARMFPRKKEALEYAKTLPSPNGFSYRAVKITLPNR